MKTNIPIAEMAGRECERLQAINAELLAALKVLADIPLESFGHDKRKDSYPIMGWNEHVITVGHVKQARVTIAKAQEEAA